jgi:hypothetical protein
VTSRPVGCKRAADATVARASRSQRWR